MPGVDDNGIRDVVPLTVSLLGLELAKGYGLVVENPVDDGRYCPVPDV